MVTIERTTEIEVSLENQPGTLGDVTQQLADDGINILGFACLAQGSEGTACFVTDDPSTTIETLEQAGLDPVQRPSVFVPTPNEPGQLASLSNKLGDSGVNIERSFVAADPNADEIGIGFTVDDVDQAAKVLQG